MSRALLIKSADQAPDQGAEQSVQIEKEDSIVPLFLIGSVVILLWAVSWGVLVESISDSAKRGEFGDMFGAVNALFSGLAFSGIIYTIFLQRKELRLQRIELAATRTELRRTAKAQEDAKEALSQQVTNQLRAARIHGLSTLVEHFTERLKDVGPFGTIGHEPDYSQHMASRNQFLMDLIKEVEESA